MIVYGVVSIRGQASFSRAIHPRRDGVFHQAPKLKTRYLTLALNPPVPT